MLWNKKWSISYSIYDYILYSSKLINILKLETAWNCHRERICASHPRFSLKRPVAVRPMRPGSSGGYLVFPKTRLWGECSTKSNENERFFTEQKPINSFFVQKMQMIYLMVSTHLKNMSENGNLPQIGMKMKNSWNHHLADDVCEFVFWGLKEVSSTNCWTYFIEDFCFISLNPWDFGNWCLYQQCIRNWNDPEVGKI